MDEVGMGEGDSGTGPRLQMLSLRADAPRLAVLTQAGSSDGAASARRADPTRPGLVWLSGFKSEMTSTKATHLAEWAARQGLALTRFDYSGHGQSEGRFEDGTLGRWLEETLGVIARVTRGPRILVGSSMGGFLALLAAARLNAERPGRVAGLVLIAPAWDMVTELLEPRLSQAARETIARDGVWQRPSAYGDGPYAITAALIEDGRRHAIAGQGLDPGCPVRILQGMADPDVPWRHAVRLVDELSATDIALTLVKDGEHRLSRPRDLAALTALIDGLVARA